jgi:nitrite reductase/ring-hydroxylating ferredoxin subunit
MAERYVVATVDEIAPGTCKIVTVNGREVGVFHVDGEFFALFNRCPHQGAALCRGALVHRLVSAGPGNYSLAQDQVMLRCPWHCWEFDLRTGQSWCDPSTIRARTYDVNVEPGTALAKGPFTAETVPVRVEKDYVVITV